MRYFIDCGGYDGCSIRKFFDSHSGYQAISFEPNPVMAPFYRDLPTTLVPKAVWTHDGEVPLYLDEADYDGSSVMRNKTTIVGRRCIVVPCVDFSSWLLEHTSAGDEVILKMDIEGAEYAVLERMLRLGSFARVGRLLIEFHGSKIGVGRSDHNALVKRIKATGVRISGWNALGRKWRRFDTAAGLLEISSAR